MNANMKLYSNKELLKIVFGESADNLWNEFNSLKDITTATAYELKQIDGIGGKKALGIMALGELVNRIRFDYVRENSKQRIIDASSVFEAVQGDYIGEKREILIALLLNCKGEIESKEIISIGELTGTNVHPREVFSPAIRKGAAGIIITHNHPSGDPTPSDEDILATRRLIEASRILGVKLLDHVICTENKYVSLKVEGIIPSD